MCSFLSWTEKEAFQVQIVFLIEVNNQVAVEVVNMVSLRFFCLVAHSHRKLKLTQVCLEDNSSTVAQGWCQGHCGRCTSPLCHPHSSLRGTPGYISRDIKCNGTFYWRVLKVYFLTETLVSRYSDYSKRGKKGLLSKVFYFGGSITGLGSSVLSFVLMHNTMWYPSDCIEKLLDTSKKCLQLSSQQCF